MLCIKSTTQNPAFNLATEEYLLRNKEEECFYLYINGPSIIVGKHQNTLAEINIDYVKAQNIDVIRRLSGGGAVFHDPGNLNFTFIKKGEKDQLVDFRKYTRPILDVLQSLGVNARFEGRNDLTIDGKKFSGNAEHVYKSKILHHGTLLFSSKLPDLSQALKVNPLKYKDKAVKSVRSRVTNISDHLNEAITLQEFEDRIMTHIRDMYADSRIYELTEEDKQGIQKLVDEKFGTWDWNFGYSPEYNFQKGIKTEGGHIEVNLDVNKGIIRKAKIFGDFFNTKDISEVESLLINTPHEYKHLKEQLSRIDVSQYFSKVTREEFLEGLF
ncbi:MAG TPA: lipoate--protein ligase [Salinivirga sp.]|uniref:lipoate--protein ligase n=1 Tax=Salinivirga sp. TaxID=1970192 RepID=UPI002B47F525|nr:lipoate--protein ligase [Salinivirga sp.]HKK58884.1 lipoate--protein ligase [Salinivirga sp.]